MVLDGCSGVIEGCLVNLQPVGLICRPNSSFKANMKVNIFFVRLISRLNGHSAGDAASFEVDL
jgi:hypothetical protein